MQRRSDDAAICEALRQTTVAGNSDFWTSYVRKTLLHVADVTEFSSQQATQAAQAFLDAEMEAMKRTMRTLSARRNAMVSFVSRIPEDVLLQVFAYLVDDDPPRLVQHEYEHRRCLGWIRVTHVCRSWRDAALADSSLWARIECDITIDWTLAMLSRSNERPLIVDVDFDSSDPQVVVEIIGYPSRRQRVSELCLRIDRIQAVSQDWFEDLEEPAPLLESLSLHLIENDDDAALPMFLSAARIPVYGASRCTIVVGKYAYDKRPSVEQLIPIFQTSPRLQTLILDQFRPQDDNMRDTPIDMFLNYHRIRLPHLRTLTLHGDHHAVPLLLCQVEIPTSAVVSLELGSYQADAHPSWSFIPQLLPWGAAAHRHQADTHFESLDLGVHSRELTMSVTSCDPGPHPRLTVRTSAKGFDIHFLVDLVEIFYAQKYFTHISSLIVEPEYVAGPGIDKLLALPGISRLLKLQIRMPSIVFKMSNLKNVIYLLGTLALPAEDSRGTGVLKLPALRHLVLDGVPSKAGNIFGFPDKPRFEEFLVGFFAHRRSRGKPLFQFTAMPSDETVELTSRVEKYLESSDSSDVFDIPAEL
ncbi:hypothetical protein EVG20_g5458 [Dentipellis fragilis]|uniref:F-box domain-containing protein n=1 Tax=Dentipellis fragilis TaxID=205917 RepID=A0A4Y9YV65_9AGAM|nr:hypothetical protein EVG20_g5458 [Dentipellis fragilis]